MLIWISSNQLSVSLQSELRPWLLLHGEWAACQRSSTQSDYFVTVRMSVCGNAKGLCDFSNSALWLSLTRRGWFPSSYCRPHSDALILNRSEMFSFFFYLHLIFFPSIFDSWPSAGCCLCSNLSTPVRRLSIGSLPEEDHDREPVLLPPPDYSDDAPPSPIIASTPTPTPKNMVSTQPLIFYGDGPDLDSPGSPTWRHSCTLCVHVNLKCKVVAPRTCY